METKQQLEHIQRHIGKVFDASPSPFMLWLQPVVLSAEQGKLSFQYKIRKEMTNPVNGLHGGVIAAIIDDIIGATMYSFNEDACYITINNVIDYFVTAKENDIVIADTSIIKKGNQIVNAHCKVWNEGRTRLIANGYSNLLKTNMHK